MESQILVDVKPKPALPGMPKIRRPGEDSSRSWCWVFDLKAGPLNTWESGRPPEKYNECRKYIVYAIVYPLKRTVSFPIDHEEQIWVGPSVIVQGSFLCVPVENVVVVNRMCICPSEVVHIHDHGQ